MAPNGSNISSQAVARYDDAQFEEFEEDEPSAEAQVPEEPVDSFPRWQRINRDIRERPLRDVRYYADHPRYPSAHQYPNVPSEIFERPPPYRSANAVIDALWKRGLVQHDNELLRRPAVVLQRHGLIFESSKGRTQLIGEGQSAQASYVAAFMALLHHLHASGELEHRIGDEETLEEILAITMYPAEKELARCKLQVHNFAAKYRTTPQRLIKADNKGSIEVSIAIPNTPYSASAVESTRRAAELAAYMRLKKAIECNVLARNEAFDVRDASHVNLDNALQILEFFKFFHPHAKLRISARAPATGLEEPWWTCSLFWDDEVIAGPHEMPHKLSAIALVRLEAAIHLTNIYPDLFQDCQQKIRNTKGAVARSMSSAFVSLDDDVIETLDQCVDASNDAELRDFALKPHVHGYKPIVGKAHKTRLGSTGVRYLPSTQSPAARSEALKIQNEMHRYDPRTAEIHAFRANLPIRQHEPQVIAMIKNHDQCIIVGSTGSGKSTQVPQIILDDAIAEGRGAMCNIVCAQPRRVACVSLALTVCSERYLNLGDIVGYRIGGDLYSSSRTMGSVNFLTLELLARDLERWELDDSVEAQLHRVSHIIVDEIHERSQDLDRLLATIKLTFSKQRAAGIRPPKLVLMSATVETNLFERYFEMVSQDGTTIRPPILNVPGKQFTTEMKLWDSFRHNLPDLSRAENKHSRDDHILDPAHLTQVGQTLPSSINPENALTSAINWNSAMEERIKSSAVLPSTVATVVATIVHLLQTTERGAILAFLPGAHEIRRALKALNGQHLVDVTDTSRYQLLLLHSQNPSHLPLALQEDPLHRRRIILATSIAETSITIPWVEYIVDSGVRRDAVESPVPTMEWLGDKLITRTSMIQRAGRAGRTGPGTYLSALNKHQVRTLKMSMDAEVMHQSRLEEIYLRNKVHFPNNKVEDVFDAYMTPVSKAKVAAAARRLKDIGALTNSGDVSSIGYSLYRTAMPPFIGRVILLGIIFRCIERAIIIANLLFTENRIFDEAPFGPRLGISETIAVKRRFARGIDSDILAGMHAYEDYRLQRQKDERSASQWASDNDLHATYLEHLHLLVTGTRSIFEKAGFIGRHVRKSLNDQADNYVLLKFITLVGVYPNVATHRGGDKFVTHGLLEAHIASTSISWSRREEQHDHHDGSIMCYSSLTRNGVNAYGREIHTMFNLTRVSPLMIALASNDVRAVDGQHNQLLVDGTIPLSFSGSENAASAFLRFKAIFDRAALSGMQTISDVWSILRVKRLPTGMVNIILGAMKELLEHEEGQAQRRRKDVGDFYIAEQKIDNVTRADNGLDSLVWRSANL